MRPMYLLAGMVLALQALSAGAQELSLVALAERVTLDSRQISVSGISSGAYMAQQMHVIHSARISGAGLVAGGPYRCAGGSYPPWSWFDATGLYAATSRCSNTNPFWFYGGPPDAAFSVEQTRAEARRGGVDDPGAMAGDRVWLFSGSEDDTVPRDVVNVLADYYRHFIAEDALHYEQFDGAGHAMITEDRGNACAASRPPFISDCDFDAAGRLLAHIHGPLRARAEPAAAGSLLRFDQRPFFDAADASVSLHSFGYVYVPRACAEGVTCTLHVVFHGCQQSAQRLGARFAEESGYNRWAASNAMVVLYPQTRDWSRGPLTLRANPKGCWDWWGYSGPDYHRRDGKQPAALAAMVNALLGATVLDAGSAR